jgi:hypothetical protein
LSTIKDRLSDLELRLEAFQSVNVELIRLVVELGMDPAKKNVLTSILRDWALEIDLEASTSKDALGAEIQKMFINYFEEKISGRAGNKN